MPDKSKRIRTRAKVCILQQLVPAYRLEFFARLKQTLGERNIELVLLYDTPVETRWSLREGVEVPFGVRIQNRYLPIGRKRALCWQPCLRHLRGADLVIVEQATRMLVNYVLLAQQMLGLRKLAFWGHGKKLDTDQAIRWAERIKRWMSRKVAWWFAYNELSANIVRSLGFPGERITCVQNTIDTKSLIQARQAISNDELEALRKGIGLTGRNVGLFSGTMYPAKRIGFLLDSARRIRKAVPDFEMLFIGDGPDNSLVKSAAKTDPWIHYVGAKHETEKVPYWMLAKVLLVPGVVGLVIVDAFALEVPLVTTDVTGHGPEIDYLRDGVNGIMVRANDDPGRYASVVADLLKNEPKRRHLIVGCEASQQTYTLDNMVNRFTEGIQQSLMQ